MREGRFMSIIERFKLGSELQEIQQNTYVAMHLLVARLISICVIFCLLPT